MVERFEHPRQMPRTRRDGRGLAALRWAGTTGDDRGDAPAERLLHDLRTDEVHVAVDRARGQDAAVTRDHLRGGAHHQIGMHARHDVRVAGLADGGNAAVANTDVRLDDSPVIDDDHAGDDGVGRTVGPGGARLAHRLAEHLAAAEDRLVACPPRTAAAVLGDLDEQIGVGEADAIAGGRTEQCGVAGTRELAHVLPSSFPGGVRDRPWTSRLPLSGTSETCCPIPGSKRTAVPAGMSSR